MLVKKGFKKLLEKFDKIHKDKEVLCKESSVLYKQLNKYRIGEKGDKKEKKGKESEEKNA